MQTTTQRPTVTTPLPNLTSLSLSRKMFDRVSRGTDDRPAFADRPESASAETEFKLSGSYRKFTRIQVSADDVDIAIYLNSSAQQVDEQQIVRRAFRAITERLREKHPAISTNERVLGGAPHLNGLRVSVANVLTHLHHLGNVDAVIDEFKQRITGEQVRQALAYAHDFMEMACDPSEDDD